MTQVIITLAERPGHIDTGLTEYGLLPIEVAKQFMDHWKGNVLGMVSKCSYQVAIIKRGLAPQ